MDDQISSEKDSGSLRKYGADLETAALARRMVSRDVMKPSLTFCITIN